MSQFFGFGIRVELKDGKLIEGKIAKATSKGLTLNEVKFGDGGTSQAFKVRASRLKDLKVLSVATSKKEPKEQKLTQRSHSEGKDWQDDDVSKLKEQEDFDFQGNLRMFNKKDVFAELKQKDDVAPEDRLVSHNKKAKETNGRYQNDEMVIPNAKDDAWNAISSDDDDEYDDDDEEYYDVDNGTYLPVTKSINITHLLHSAKGGTDKDSQQGQVVAQLEKMIKGQTRARSISAGPGNPASTALLKIKDSDQTVPMATPVQLMEIERVNSEQFGVTSDIMLENFATNASFFLKHKLGGRTRLRRDNHNPEPLVVILTSDSNRSGARSMALGRHLCQSGHIRVIALFTCSAGDLQDSQVKEQYERFRKCGGKVVNSVGALKSTVDKLNSPVEIVIDAMQGFDCSLTDLDESSSATQDYDTSTSMEARALDMINWCNLLQGQVQVWSLDIPSGYDSGTGLANFGAMVSATGVISSGWPLAALKTVKQGGSYRLQECAAIDMGTPHCVYSQRTSLRKFQSRDLFITEGFITLEF
ncbi:hypothetical protein HG536_0G03530 [Torulaspora globosa]|uniref:Enhancer of mRNA-decapping protein 3 n=1 Tax=Torulaspora globosa TaxID=48254 RepID=A0A7G3ZLV5_9SACH|nr:uncharacterized protein HG536_0G03530 [Torulaspora globosa]QLL34491.1 hypothetical protein HG536_0G03530 [Torulaspora globosa]